MKISDELGKPIIHHPDHAAQGADGYFVIDGNTRYLYVLTDEKSSFPAAPPKKKKAQENN